MLAAPSGTRCLGYGVGDPADDDGLTADGDASGDPMGVGDVPVGVADGLGRRDGLSDRAGRGDVQPGLGAGVAGEGPPAARDAPTGAGSGRTTM